MTVEWLGLACFLITADNGLKIAHDPNKASPRGRLTYSPLGETAAGRVHSHALSQTEVQFPQLWGGGSGQTQASDGAGRKHQGRSHRGPSPREPRSCAGDCAVSSHCCGLASTRSKAHDSNAGG